MIQENQSIVAADSLPPSLAKLLRKFVSRNRRLGLVYAAGSAAAFILIWTLAWSLFDRLLPIPTGIRLTLLLIEMAAVVVVLVRPIRRFLSPQVPWHRAAAAIEARDPQFGGGLQTALSQMLLPPDQRGSASLLAEIIDETAAKAALIDTRKLLPRSEAMRPLSIVGVALVLMLAMLPLSWLDLPQLLKRQLFPFLSTAPVTTTRLFVAPGSVNLTQGDALKITVRTERLGDSQPLLQWRGEDPVFSSAIMLPEAGDFAYTFNSIDRPFSYRVSGGNATSALFDVRVAARPSVRQLQVTYTYPNWAQLQPTALASCNGDLEGPIGTVATLSIIGSQPLSQANAIVNATRIESKPSVDPAVRLLMIPMKASGRWQLELANASGITGAGPSGLFIHVIPPQPPKVNLQIPSEDEALRLHPRDVLSLGYDVSDQFALAEITAEIAVNSLPPVTQAIPLGQNHRSQAGSFDVDFAKLAVNLGDVVTVTLKAKNQAGLLASSIPCRIVVSPRSIDLNAQERLSELYEAARLAKVMSDEVQAASNAMEQSPPGDAKEARDEQVAPHLAVADGVAAGLSRQLLRALTHSSSPEISGALVFLIDDDQRSAGKLEYLDSVLLTELRDTLRDRISQLAGRGQELQQALDTIWQGEFSAQLLAGLEDGQVDESRVANLSGIQADAVRRSAERARADENVGCAQLGIGPHAADVEPQLRQRVDRGLEMEKRFGPVDFALAANEWSAVGPNGSTGFVARLTVGSEAEIVRPSGDFIWARDLELAARAGRHIDTSVDVPPTARKDYPQTLRTLQDVHGLLLARTPASQMRDPMQAADEARRQMRFWAGEVAPTSQPSSGDSTADPQRAALEAAAADAQQKIEQEERIEQATTMPTDAASLLDLPATPDAPSDASPQNAESAEELTQLKEAIATARQLERLTAEQSWLRTQTAKASNSDLQKLARDQAALTEAIQRVRLSEALADQKPPGEKPPGEPPPDQPQEDALKDSREAAMNAIRSAQERLVEMPKEIEKARDAEMKQHAASHAADEAQHAVDGAGDESKDAAKAQASNAQVSPDEAANLAALLGKYAPETTPAVDAIDQQLTPALTAMRQTQSSDDDDGNLRATQQATQSVEEVQRRLKDGLQTLLQKDALTTAKFFSNNAAEALSRPQPDRSSAMRLQRGASAALEQSWDNALHRAAGQRMAHLPSKSALPRLYRGQSNIGAESAIGAEPAPVEREWGRLRQQKPEELTAGSHEIDPPEYQDALRVYFQDLAHQDESAKP